LEKRANTKKHRLKTYKAKALKDFKNIKSLYSLMTKKKHTFFFDMLRF